MVRSKKVIEASCTIESIPQTNVTEFSFVTVTNKKNRETGKKNLHLKMNQIYEKQN